MSLYPVSLVIFYQNESATSLKVWTQTRTDDGPFHGLLEFPGGGVEAKEAPLEAAIREVEEEVGVKLKTEDLSLMGIYPNPVKNKNILLYVFLTKKIDGLEGKGEWLFIEKPHLSQVYKDKIPGPNHKIIDDLYKSLGTNYDE